MKITEKINISGLQSYIVLSNNNKYIVDCLEGVYMCECSLKYNRNLKTNCKHIEEIKKIKNEKNNNK